MAYTTPKTYSVGDVLTASDMNTYQRDNITALHDRVYYVPLASALTSTDFDGDSFSTTTDTLIDLSDEFGVPADVSAINVRVMCRDSGSATSQEARVVLKNSMGTGGANVSFRCGGLPNDYYGDTNALINCSTSGDIYYEIYASGAGTLDAWIWIQGYWTTT